MLSFPHKPSLARARETKARILLYLQSGAERMADQWVLLGLIEYQEGAPPSTVAERTRSALESFLTALELGHRPSPWGVWAYTLRALAVGDWSSAHSIASMPEDLWIDHSNRSLHWLMMACQAVFALLRSDPLETERWVVALHDMVFDRPLPESLQPEGEEIENLHGLLEALHRGDASRFNALLSSRQALRARSFLRYGSSSPLGVVDLEGLGLCRLALARSMPPRVEHVYLPLELLPERPPG